MMARAFDTFGALLRRLRLAAGLTQEKLAERAQLSERAIRDLERDRGRTPRLQTVRLLAGALGLDDDEQARLLAAARPTPMEDGVSLRSHVQMPRILTPLIGRTEDVAVVKILLDERRLVTVVGTGGVGKTRLALAVAEQMIDRFDRVVFVELAPLRDPDHVLGALAASLSIHEESTVPFFDRVAVALRLGRPLLVLDNMEHLLTSRPIVLNLLTVCPDLSILSTSREALRVRGERVYTLGPLPLPEREADIGGSPAVQLFLDRSRDAGAEIALDMETATAVAALCRRLDGLPLAIELAAAWSPLLPPPTLLSRLTSSLSYLDHGPQDLPERQRTMRNTIAWSYNLLTADEQAIFQRLSIFTGGWTLDAALALCAGPGQEADVMAGLAGLRSKSLVSEAASKKTSPDGPRLAMLETIREYGQTTIAAAGKQETVRERYVAYYRAYAQTAAQKMIGPGHVAWRERLEREHDNLRAAVRWAIDGTDLAAAQELAEALWRYWSLRGHLTEGRQWLQQVMNMGEPISAGVLAGAAALALEQGDTEEAAALGQRALDAAKRQQRPREIVLALNVLGAVAWRHDRYQEANRYHEEALRLARTITDREGAVVALTNLSLAASFTGDAAHAATLAEGAVAEARTLGDPHALASTLVAQSLHTNTLGWYDQTEASLEQALDLFRSVQDTGKVAEALFALGTTANSRRQYERAVTLLTECLALRRARGDQHTVIASLGALGIALLNAGDMDRAMPMLEESYHCSLQQGVPLGVAIGLALLAHLEVAQGDAARARSLCTESAAILEDINNLVYLLFSLEGLAGVSALEQRWELTGRLCGTRDALLERLGSSAAPICPDAFDAAVASSRSALGDEAFEALRTEGRVLTTSQVMEEAARPT